MEEEWREEKVCVKTGEKEGRRKEKLYTKRELSERRLERGES